MLDEPQAWTIQMGTNGGATIRDATGALRHRSATAAIMAAHLAGLMQEHDKVMAIVNATEDLATYGAVKGALDFVAVRTAVVDRIRCAWARWQEGRQRIAVPADESEQATPEGAPAAYNFPKELCREAAGLETEER